MDLGFSRGRCFASYLGHRQILPCSSLLQVPELDVANVVGADEDAGAERRGDPDPFVAPDIGLFKVEIALHRVGRDEGTLTQEAGHLAAVGEGHQRERRPGPLEDEIPRRRDRMDKGEAEPSKQATDGATLAERAGE